MAYEKPEVAALVGLIGKRGSGKTTELRRYSAKCRRLIVADVEGVWQLQPGDKVIDGHAALLAELRRLKAWDAEVPFRLVYREWKNAKKYMKVVPFKYAMAIRNVTVVIDEAAHICTASHIPQAFDDAVTMGRRYFVNILYTTRQPQEVNDLLFGQAELLRFFRTDPGLGLDRIRRQYKAIAGELPNLERGVFRTYGNPNFVSLFGREGLDYPSWEELSRVRRARTTRRET